MGLETLVLVWEMLKKRDVSDWQDRGLTLVAKLVHGRVSVLHERNEDLVGLSY